MTIKYLCQRCQDELNTSFVMEAINEVGRKYCDRCGDNQDNLFILTSDEFNNLPIDITSKFKEIEFVPKEKNLLSYDQINQQYKELERKYNILKEFVETEIGTRFMDKKMYESLKKALNGEK